MHVFAVICKRGLAAFLVLFMAHSALAAPKYNRTDNWITYRNAEFGYRLFYPSAVFDTSQPAESDGGQSFITQDGRAKIVVFGTLNSEAFSPREYRRIILDEFGGYDRLDYSPQGKTWFVLSGYRGENIYYQKVIFSCGNKVINVLSVTFPTAEKRFYEPLIETMEDHFKSGRGAQTPKGC